MKIRSFSALAIGALLIITISCKKNSTGTYGNSYLKIKKNGTWVTYPAIGELGPDFADDSKTDFGVTAVSEDQNERFDLTIQIDGHNFQTGTYNTTDPSYYIDMSYTSGASGADFIYYDIGEVDGNGPSQYIIKVISITSTELKGTFTGTYLSDDIGSDPSIIPITEGEFRVKRAR